MHELPDAGPLSESEGGYRGDWQPRHVRSEWCAHRAPPPREASLKRRPARVSVEATLRAQIAELTRTVAMLVDRVSSDDVARARLAHVEALFAHLPDADVAQAPLVTEEQVAAVSDDGELSE